MSTVIDPTNEILELVEGDTLPSLRVTWEDSGDVTGYTFKLHIRYEDCDRISKDGIIEDDGALSGSAVFRFDWDPGDLVRGRHEAEIEIFYPSGDNETWQGMTLDVTRDIA